MSYVGVTEFRSLREHAMQMGRTPRQAFHTKRLCDSLLLREGSGRFLTTESKMHHHTYNASINTNKRNYV